MTNFFMTYLVIINYNYGESLNFFFIYLLSTKLYNKQFYWFITKLHFSLTLSSIQNWFFRRYYVIITETEETTSK